MESIDLSTLPVDVQARSAVRPATRAGRQLLRGLRPVVDRVVRRCRSRVRGDPQRRHRLGYLAAVRVPPQGAGGARDALDRLTTRPTANDAPGQVRYLIILDDAGRIVDEGTRYLIGPHEAWFIGNEDRPGLMDASRGRSSPASTSRIANRTDEVSSLAVQGPRAFEIAGAADGRGSRDAAVLPVPDRRRGGGGAGDDLADRLLGRARLRTVRFARGGGRGVGRARRRRRHAGRTRCRRDARVEVGVRGRRRGLRLVRDRSHTRSVWRVHRSPRP